MSDVSAPACTNGVCPPLRPVSVAQKNKLSTMLSSNVQSIDLCTALTGLDDETTEWLLNTCPEIWCGQAVVIRHWLKRKEKKLFFIQNLRRFNIMRSYLRKFNLLWDLTKFTKKTIIRFDLKLDLVFINEHDFTHILKPNPRFNFSVSWRSERLSSVSVFVFPEHFHWSLHFAPLTSCFILMMTG